MNVLIKAEKPSVKNVSAGCDSNPHKLSLQIKVKCNVMERTLSESFSPEREQETDQTLAGALTFVHTCL